MCEKCGCESGDTVTAANLQTGKTVVIGEPADAHMHEHVHADGTRHVHAHGHAPHVHGPGHGHHAHDHEDSHGPDIGRGARLIELEANILAKNDAIAARNRIRLRDRHLFAVNLMSAPGAGKTTLLERTIRDFQGRFPLGVIEGDQATTRDGERIRAAGAPAVQVNTGTGCHLDAEMVAHGLDELDPPAGALVIVENVGNLICPALFDVGEHARVVMLSVAEGDDKPLKYPHMFRAAELMLLSKIDLLPHVDFDVDRAIANAKTVNPNLSVVCLSARSGEGLGEWQDWVLRRRADAVSKPAA